MPRSRSVNMKKTRSSGKRNLDYIFVYKTSGLLRDLNRKGDEIDVIIKCSSVKPFNLREVEEIKKKLRKKKYVELSFRFGKEDFTSFYFGIIDKGTANHISLDASSCRHNKSKLKKKDWEETLKYCETFQLKFKDEMFTSKTFSDFSRFIATNEGRCRNLELTLYHPKDHEFLKERSIIERLGKVDISLRVEKNIDLRIQKRLGVTSFTNKIHVSFTQRELPLLRVAYFLLFNECAKNVSVDVSNIQNIKPLLPLLWLQEEDKLKVLLSFLEAEVNSLFFKQALKVPRTLMSGTSVYRALHNVFTTEECAYLHSIDALLNL